MKSWRKGFIRQNVTFHALQRSSVATRYLEEAFRAIIDNLQLMLTERLNSISYYNEWFKDTIVMMFKEYLK